MADKRINKLEIKDNAPEIAYVVAMSDEGKTFVFEFNNASTKRTNKVLDSIGTLSEDKAKLLCYLIFNDDDEETQK